MTVSPALRLPLFTLALSALLPGAAVAQSACTAVSGGFACAGTGTGITGGALDNSTITIAPGASITGTAQAFNVDDGNTIVNEGTVTGGNDHAIQGDNDNTVENTGRIVGGTGGDGVNIDNNGRLVNSGTILGNDDGVQLEENAVVINTETGLIEAQDEGVNVNTDNASVTNAGTIRAVDDAINAAENATIDNSGLIESFGGAQDGIDLDSGTITNSGTIRGIGSEDGIDFDASAIASTVINSGVIEGTFAINNDPANTAALTVVNTGLLVGRGGTAILFGDGDDTLQIGQGSVIVGALDFGTGTDTLILGSSAQQLSFTSAPEVVAGDAPFLLGDTGLVAFDPAALSVADVLADETGFLVATTVLDRPMGTGAWLASYGLTVGVQGDEGEDEDGPQGFDATGGGLIAGYGLSEQTGVFLSYGRSGADLDDGMQDVTQTQLLLGLRAGMETSGLRLSGTVFAGPTRTEIDSPDAIAGSGEARGLLAGLAARAAGDFGGRLDYMGQLSVVHHAVNSYDLDGEQTARIGSRDATTAALRLEVGMPLDLAAGVVRPFAAVTLASGSSDDISASAFGQAIAFEAADWQDGATGSLGVTYGAQFGAAAVSGRLEAAFAEDRDTDLRIGLGVEIPLGN